MFGNLTLGVRVLFSSIRFMIWKACSQLFTICMSLYVTGENVSIADHANTLPLWSYHLFTLNQPRLHMLYNINNWNTYPEGRQRLYTQWRNAPNTLFNRAKTIHKQHECGRIYKVMCFLEIVSVVFIITLNGNHV